MIFQKLEYLKSKQDQKQNNFGMVGMGYVVNVLNEYEKELENLKKENEFLKTEIDNSKWTIAELQGGDL